MSRPDQVAERLREYVRARVRKDGPYYEWGNGTRLAEYLEIDRGWVTAYTDDPPSRHADIDMALAICRFFDVDIRAFDHDAPPLAPPTALRPLESRGLKLLKRISKKGLGEAVGLLARYARVYPLSPKQVRSAPPVHTRAETSNTAHGKR